jgi:hypothetical protein
MKSIIWKRFKPALFTSILLVIGIPGHPAEGFSENIVLINIRTRAVITA